MPIPDFGGLGPDPSYADLVNKINQLVQKLRTLMLNLDTLNVVSLNAKVIEASTITADKMNVSQLSAIAADLGTITAGIIRGIEIYGSYIATAEGTYPRSEMSVVDNLFAVFKSVSEWLKMTPALLGSPQLVFNDGYSTSTIAMQHFLTSYLNIVSQGGVYISAASGSTVDFDSFDAINNLATSQSLQTALNAKANSFSGATGSADSTNTLTFVNGICTSIT